MSKLPISDFKPVDIAPTARNWVADEDGEWRRMGSHADAVTEVQRSINNLLAWHQRTTISQAWPILTAVLHRGTAPYMRWRLPDKVRNARTRWVSGIGVVPANTAGTSEIHYAKDETDTTGYAVTPYLWMNHAGAQSEANWYQAYGTAYAVNRGSRADADVTQGINCYAEMTLVSVSGWDALIEQLDTTVHEFCDTSLAKKGGKVLADALEDCRETFHRVRSENLPVVLQWSSMTIGAAPDAPGNATGITVSTNEAAGRVNLWDSSDVNGPGDTSVGAYQDAWRAGIGPEWSSNGSRVPVTVRVYGQTVGADNGYGTVTFYGPSTASPYTDNNVSVNVYNELAWYGGDSNQVYLNAAVPANTLNVEGNRICAYGTVQNSGVPMHIYGVRAWMYYPYGTE